MSKKEKNCLNCRIHWDREGCCEVCRWEDEDHPSLFYQITRSPEVLAESSVYFEEEHTLVLEDSDCGVTFPGGWTSPFIEYTYGTKPEAIAATVAKLKGIDHE